MAFWGHSKGKLVIWADLGTALLQRSAVTQTPLASALVPQGTPGGCNTQAEEEKGGMRKGEGKRERRKVKKEMGVKEVHYQRI